mmetsp:Transcript_14388/g.15562  ORF Transcript_14388/g.15562 Transcript_14388/m.15562 type:complete len:269 (-) Transcript_14388:415-1221(-)
MIAFNSLSFFSSSIGEKDDGDSNSPFDEILQFYELDDDDLSSSQPVMVKAKRRKRKSSKRPSTNPAFMPALRILRRDIRRKYCDMIYNVINSHDPTLISKFFHDFSIPNVQRVLQLPSDTLQSLHQTLMITGIEEQVKDFCMNYTLMPDVIFTFTDVKVCKSTNICGSRVVARTLVRGTLLYSARNKRAEKKDLMERYDPATIVTTATCESIERTDDLILQPLETPLNYEMHGIVTLHLDDQHRMVFIEIQPLDSTPHLSPSLLTMRR